MGVFSQPWTRRGNQTLTDDSGVTYRCRYAEYQTFYNGPNRTDPGLVPDGASCGTGKVGPWRF